MIKAQVRETGDYQRLHVQVKSDEDCLRSLMNRGYGYAFNIDLDDVAFDALCKATEDLEATLPSLAGTEAKYYPAIIERDCLYVNGTFITKLPEQYEEAVEEPQEKELKEQVEVDTGLDTTDKWVIILGDDIVFVQSKEKPEVKKVREVINVNMS